jgi:aspartyl/asparaginyl beta-hydroxylase (cupin superfamily)
MSAHQDARVRSLIDSAMRALSAGQHQEAERLMGQAQTEAPRHPLVLNEAARQLLMAGNAAAAHKLLESVVRVDGSHASLWLNLAAALRALNRGDEEMAALDKVLALDPRNIRARLQTGSLHELKGNPRAAAMSYRFALQLIPPDFDPPAPVREVVQHAREIVAANDRSLETFLDERLQHPRARHTGEPLRRFDKCLATLLHKNAIYRSQPSFMYFPELPPIEFHDREHFPWLDSIEAATADIRDELAGVLSEGTENLEPYVRIPEGMPLDRWGELNQSRRWGVYYLWREGVAFPEHIARCPRTAAALEAWPRYDVPSSGPTAVFSILDAKTRIPPHTGVSNTRLIVHLPLIIPPGCEFRVGAERRAWHPGKAFVFDDTFEHEASNESDVPRAVLILDIWNPCLSAAERDLLRAATAAVSEFYDINFFRGG